MRLWNEKGFQSNKQLEKSKYYFYFAAFRDGDPGTQSLDDFSRNRLSLCQRFGTESEWIILFNS